MISTDANDKKHTGCHLLKISFKGAPSQHAILNNNFATFPERLLFFTDVDQPHHARVILANDHTAIAEKWTMNKSTYICPIEKSGIFQPSNLQGSSWEDSPPCKNLQLPGQHPVSCKQIFGVASRYGNCTCPVRLNVGLPGITHSSLKWGSPGKKRDFPRHGPAKTAAKKNRDRLIKRDASH